MEVRLLGPIEVVGPAGTVSLTSSRQRAIIALLALSPGVAIPMPRLVQGLWGDDAPRTAARTLQSHLTRARQALAACGLGDLMTSSRVGYAMVIDPQCIDAYRFEDQVRTAQRDLADGHIGRSVEILRTALALWRGDALQDTELFGWGAAEVNRLHQVRLTALEDICDGQLRQGGHLTAVGELKRLLVTHPGRERLVGLLMLASYRCGQHAEALTSYLHLREHLADTLGVDPSPELERLHTAILRRDPSLDLADHGRVERVMLVVPTQLPSRVGHFSGRHNELARLDQVLDEDSPAAEAQLVLVSGAAGMGKTALAVEWAHLVADRFPDGQVFLDLQGHDEATAVAPADAVRHVLLALGVPPERIPTPLSEQATLYRSAVHGGRILVVLDNVGSAEHVLPLVPSVPGCLLVATSRKVLPSLAVRHAVHRVELDMLSHLESIALLVRILGADRVEREAESAGQLVAACGHMPLALRIAAAKLGSRPRLRIADLVAELAREDRLDVLSAPGDSQGIRAVFASAYQALTSPAAEAFRLLGLHPGPNFAAPLVAAVTGSTVATARRVTEELAAAHLAGEIASERFRFHDLIRWYARECALVQESPHRRSDAIGRILDWYLGVTDAANRILTPGRVRAVVSLAHPLTEMPFALRHQDTLVFLDEERENLVSISRYAVEHGHDATAWQLAYLLMGFFYARGHWVDMLEVCRSGLAAARRQGDPATEALMRSQVGVASIQVQRYDDALDELRQALPLMVAAGDIWGEGIVVNNIAVALTSLRRFDEALSQTERALAVHTANGQSPEAALSLHNMGDIHTRMGHPDQGLTYLARAHALVRPLGDERIEAIILHGTGAAHLRQGAFPIALELFGRALSLQRQVGNRRNEVDTLNDKGMALLGLGSVADGLDTFDRALRLTREMADPHREAITLKNIGLAHLRANSLAAAEHQLSLSLSLRTRIPDMYEEAEVYRWLGELEERRGNAPAARSHRGTAIALYQKANATTEATDLAESTALGVAP